MSVSSLCCGSRLTASRIGSVSQSRLFSAAASRLAEVQEEKPRRIETVPGTRREEWELLQQNKTPVGSRRRRRAQYFTTDLPFEQLPYQCFQEARKVLKDHRDEKLQKIAKERARIAGVEARDAAEFGGEASKKGKLVAMNKHMEELKIAADINDPVILKTFEDGQGDLNKPIYRHYAEKKWRDYKYKLLVQRIEQMHVIPDLIPQLDPVADLSMAFGKHKVHPGEFVDSQISEHAPSLALQVFDAGERMVTIAVVDADVPNLETDGFDFQCHYLATNIPIAPTQGAVSLAALADSQVVFPWLPPHAQKGAPYHRLAVLVYQQPAGKLLDAAAIKAQLGRRGFNPRALSSRHGLKPVTASLFRAIWDEHTAEVMARAGLPGADVEFKRKKPEKQHWKHRVKDGERYR